MDSPVPIPAEVLEIQLWFIKAVSQAIANVCPEFEERIYRELSRLLAEGRPHG